ncbi:MAG: hypothetical protein JXJ04_25720 [Spirochaetales bacterium]|nr:hypothetical protein [Spirochaetales bacterium]
MIVSVDKETGDLEISLPPGYEGYGQTIRQTLYEEFAFEPLSKSVIGRMNQFVEEWFKQQGIELKPEEEEK